MKALILAVLLLVGAASHALATTWNPSDKVNVTLTNGNLTATIISASGAVRSTTSKTTGRFCTEATNTQAASLFVFGLANSSLDLANNPSSPSFAEVVPFDSSAPQSLWLGGTELSSGSTISAAGEAVTVCADLGAKLLWVTDATMRAAGNPWNNSTTADPATGTGGASFSSMVGPYFVAFGSSGSGTAAATLNVAGPFAVTTPSGFSTWDGTPAASNLQPDLSNAAAHPVTGFPANKIAYSIHVFPYNVANASPDAPLATVTPIWNTYFGSLVRNGTAPVVNFATGCSCDGSNGSLSDDQAFMGNWTTYANGLATGGPAFAGIQQPMGNAWYSWGNYSENPNGTLNSDGTLKGTISGQAGGQAFYWSQLLFNPGLASPTTWNGLDASAGVVLSNNNTTATTNAATPQAVRATTSKSTGKACFGVAAGTITPHWAVGLSNPTYVLTATGSLGSDTTSIGFDPDRAGTLQAIFFGNATLSSGSATSANGETAMVCADFDTSRFWATDSAMRTALGSSVWNNTAGCDPTNASCGVLFSGMTCPCFPTYANAETGSAATLRMTAGVMPFALPSGFSAWDLAVTGGRPMILIFGSRQALDERGHG
jgi:hypothetical protein